MDRQRLLDAHARCSPHTQRVLLHEPPQGSVAVPPSYFHDISSLRQEVVAHAQRLGTQDVRVAASLWGKHYVGAVVPGLLALRTLEDVSLDAGPSQVQVVLRDGLPAAAALPEPRVLPSDDALAFTTPLLDDHLAPVIRALELASGLWGGVVWNSAGNSIAWYLDRFEETAPERAARDRQVLLDDEASPLHDPVVYEHLRAHGLDKRVPVRRTCCLKYRLPNTDACYTCPRIDSKERAALVRALEARS